MLAVGCCFSLGFRFGKWARNEAYSLKKDDMKVHIIVMACSTEDWVPLSLVPRQVRCRCCQTLAHSD